MVSNDLKKQFNILKRLLNDECKKQKSSHWEHYTKEFHVTENRAISGIDGFGGSSKNTFSKRIGHNILQRLLFNNIFKSSWYKLFKQVAKAQDRVIDIDAVRHLFTFDLLDRYLLSKNKINNVCVIGDGRTNFVSPSLRSNRFKKVISVNLVETLLSDLSLLETENVLKENEVSIVTTDNDLSDLLVDSETRLILIPAQNVEIIFNKGIELFVNINSFQEMNAALVNNYFKIIKSNNAYFYCCNREYKKLHGGEVLEFSKYPWGDPRIIINEYCPWSQRYYNIRRFPFIFNYNGKIIHRLVYYN